MRLKLYRAPAMAQAMALVRAELGEDALILATRRVDRGVEVTAALEPDEPLPMVAPPDPTRLAALDFHGVPVALHDSLLQGELAAALAKALPFGTLPLGQAPLLLVGPPGAGKTLTVARLATRLVMAGILPMVITADGKRAGAIAAAAMVLVLPAGLDPAEAADQARTFAALGARLLVATRLDMARRLGGILAAAGTGLALTEAGIGPGAADGLLPITPAWLAARLMTGPHT